MCIVFLPNPPIAPWPVGLNKFISPSIKCHLQIHCTLSRLISYMPLIKPTYSLKNVNNCFSTVVSDYFILKNHNDFVISRV